MRFRNRFVNLKGVGKKWFELHVRVLVHTDEALQLGPHRFRAMENAVRQEIAEGDLAGAERARAALVREHPLASPGDFAEVEFLLAALANGERAGRAPVAAPED